MTERRTDDTTLIAAVRIIARTIQSEDGVIPACLAEAAARLETLVDERRWISVGDLMPQDNVAVLAAGYVGVEMVFRQKGTWFLAFHNIMVSDSTYTHWQPLPTPPEGTT